MSVLRRRDAAPGGPEPAGPLGEDSFSTQYPGIWEFLSVFAFPDGTPRRAGTLLLFVDEGMVKACLTDRHHHLQAWVTAYGLITVLAGVEHGLQSDSLTWRKCTPWKGKGRK